MDVIGGMSYRLSYSLSYGVLGMMETRSVTVRLPVELVDALEVSARAAGRTLSTEVRVRLSRSLKLGVEKVEAADGLGSPSEPVQAVGGAPDELQAADVVHKREASAKIGMRAAEAALAARPGLAQTVIGRHRHLGNPLLPTVGLPVAGEAAGFNLKEGKKK
jgi:hypothetical protein